MDYKVLLYSPGDYMQYPVRNHNGKGYFKEKKVKVKVTQSCPTLCEPYSSWNSLGQNTGVGSLSLLQGIFPTQGSNPGLPHCRQILYQLYFKECVFVYIYICVCSVKLLSRVQLFVTPWTTAQASLSLTNSWSLPKLMPIESMMPSSHFILCRLLLLLPSILPSIRVFSNELVLCIRWPKYWSFSFNISPSNEYPGLISFRMD